MRRDFSESAKQELLSLVAQVESEKWSDFTDWWGDHWYDFEAWIGALDIKDYIDNVNEYHKRVIDKNNTTSGDIEKIFVDVNEVNINYRGRLAALLTDLQSYRKVIDEMGEVVTPANGKFNPEYIGSGLKDSVNSYLADSKTLQVIAGDGLTQEEVEDMDQEKLQSLLDLYAVSILENTPGIGIGDELEVPVGPGVTFYYKVSSDIEGNGNVEIQTVIDEQKLGFKELKYSEEYGGIKIGTGVDKDGTVSVNTKTPYGNEVKLNGEGMFEYSYENTVGANTYKYSYGIELVPPALTMEESIKTDLEGGSVTSAIGLKYQDNSSWTPLAEPVPVESPYTCQLPEFDVDWKTVQVVGTKVVEGVVITAGIGALIYFTGGWGVLVLA